jgi:tetratricopeptide (TPR) repeat protein
VRDGFRSPEVLGRAVRRDLTRLINKFWPEGSQPDALDRETMDHEAFAQSRERVYIGRQEYFDGLDGHAAANDAQPLVILGESGSGKSALLANWVARYRQAHPDALVLQHYIGATPYSADWAAMLRRLIGEFKRRLGLQQDIPNQPDALRSAFPNWIYMAAAKGRVVLVLDALNQLEDRDGAPDLVWLPTVLPENVRLIVSTLPGRPLVEIQKRNWPTLKIELLSADERRKLITEYLAQHAKSLSPARMDRIVTAPPSANALYLRVLLDELRVVRTHEELEGRISDYLKAESPYALYEKVIARWEQDYEGDSDLVGDTLSFLWAARRGVTETELLQALGKDGEPMPRAKWSPLFLAMSDALISRGGLLTFAHEFLRTAVENAYLPTAQNQQAAHLRLADYFERQPANLRRTDELPWQLAAATEWPRLQALLVNCDFFAELWKKNQFEVKIYWARIEGGSSLRMVDAYRALKESDQDHLWRFSSLLDDTGHPEESLRIQNAIAAHSKSTNDLATLQASLGNQTVILRKRGDLDGAMTLHKEKERICRQLGNLDGLQAPLGNQAVILQERGDLDGAMTLRKEEERICRQLGNPDGLQASLSGQALILYARGDLDEAMTLHKETERICRQLGDLDGLLNSLGNQGLILQDRGDLDGAMTLHKEGERICRQLGDLDGLLNSLGNQGLILQVRGDLDGAMTLHKQTERLCRQLGNLDGLQASLGNRALIMQARGDLDGAMTLHKEKERLCRRLGNLDSLSKSLVNQAVILQARGDSDGAMMLLKEHERICRQLRNVEGTATSLANQSLVLRQRGQAQQGLALAEEAHQLASSHGYSALAKRTASILNSIKLAIANPATSVATPARTPSPLARETSVPELRELAGNALRRGNWEAAATFLEYLLQKGEPVENVAPDLITTLLNAHETITPATVTRIETLLALLDSTGHTTIAAPLREKLTTKLAASSPKKPWWKLL